MRLDILVLVLILTLAVIPASIVNGESNDDLAHLTGFVYQIDDGEKIPISFVKVEIFENDTLIDSMWTANNGSYSFILKPGMYTVNIEKARYIPQKAFVILASNATLKVDFPLELKIPPISTYEAIIIIEGLPEYLYSELLVDGIFKGYALNDTRITFEGDTFHAIELSEFDLGNTKYVPKRSIVYVSAGNSSAFFQYIRQFKITSDTNPEIEGWHDDGEIIRLEAREVIVIDISTRLVFNGWAKDGQILKQNPLIQKVDGSFNINSTYKKQYLLTVNTEMGSAEGGGWYDEDTLAKISIIEEDEGSFLFKFRFVGWKGDLDSKNSTASILMDEPKTVNAVWESTPIISPQIAAIIIFILVYFFIATGWRERTIASMVGVAALWFFDILPKEKMIGYIDFNAIGLLFGMMVLVGVLDEANFFRWIGFRLVNLCAGNTLYIFILFTSITAFLSALLDNVTTVLFMVAITLEIADFLKIDPKPYIIAEILASNIGGTATLIGDPPNIMIASATGLTFIDFINNTMPISLVAFALLIFLLNRIYKAEFRASTEKSVTMSLRGIISDKRLFRIGLGIFIATISMLFIHDFLHMPPAAIVMASAIIILFIGGVKMPRILERVEWRTLIFFTCLFIIVGSLVETGTIEELAIQVVNLVGWSGPLMVSMVLWVSAIASGIIDNIPLVAAFIPMIQDISRITDTDVSILWWALSLGAGFGGNGTLIGASANIVAIGVAEAKGVKISFMDFLKVGAITMIITIVIANIYLLLRFF
ncbi:MAG: SLC13 family permease [Candidatus Bathyarchaeota archaeon]|nr:SLC13 family permease [Candidatus Bathyarchaeota archaeon]